MSIDVFSNQTFLGLIDCLFWFIWIEIMVWKVIVPKGIIYQKVLSKFITEWKWMK